MRTLAEYVKLLQSLLPKGKAWNRAAETISSSLGLGLIGLGLGGLGGGLVSQESSVLAEFLTGEAEEFVRVDERSDTLLKERDTRYASELLEDHELDLGLPDECSSALLTVAERRQSAHSKFIAVGRQNPAYFIELAIVYGWNVTIVEFSPFWCGLGESGDPCGDQENIFYWQVIIDATEGNIIYFTSGGGESGDLLVYLPGIEEMLCRLNQLKPAHTVMFYNFEGPEFDRAFSPAFDSIPSGASTYLEGAFWREFSTAFDVHYGGEFDATAFNRDFRRPAIYIPYEGGFDAAAFSADFNRPS